MNDSIYKSIKTLPPLDDTVIKIQQICRDDNSVMSDLIDVIKKDPMLTANILHSANSPLYGFSREIIQKGGFTCPNTTILIVDDNEINLTAKEFDVLELLVNNPNKVYSRDSNPHTTHHVTAISGQECLNVVSKMHVDIIFLDYMMPEMNGIDTLYALKALDFENVDTLPVVALTANVVSGAKEMFLDAGFCEYISKPIDVKRLETTLKTYLPREQLKVKI